MSLELFGIFGAGLLTFVTPCVLPLIPIYLALLLSEGDQQPERHPLLQRLTLFIRTLMFSLGLLAVFVLLGLSATSAGALLAEYRTQLVVAGGLLIFLFGLKFLGLLQLPWLDREKRLDDRKLHSRFPLLNALVMGAVFGLGWTPCIGPILGSVLTYTASSSSNAAQGALYLASYGLGFVLPLLLLSLLGDGARRVVRLLSRQLPRLERISGLALVGVGLYLVFGAGAPPSAPASAQANRPQSPATARLGEASKRPTMVQFSSPRCPICRQMIPTVSVIERDCDGRQVDVLKVDVNKRPELARKYRIRGVPTFVFFDTAGAEVARLVGYQSLASLRQSLSALTGQRCDGLGAFAPAGPARGPAPNSSCGAPAAQLTAPAPGSSCGG